MLALPGCCPASGSHAIWRQVRENGAGAYVSDEVRWSSSGASLQPSARQDPNLVAAKIEEWLKAMLRASTFSTGPALFRQDPPALERMSENAQLAQIHQQVS